MSNKFQAPDRGTVFLMPPSVDEWLPKRHLARLIVDVIGELDLRPLEREYAGCGSKPYHPGMLVGVLFYGYATGIFSSRKLEAATYELIPMRYVCGNLHPDHDTIAAFRKRFLPHLGPLFRQILMMAHEVGLLKVGTVSLDGSKVKANASKHKALSWARAQLLEQQCEAEARRLLELAEEADRQEEAEELDIPAELAHREERKKIIRKAMAEIKARAKERYAKEVAEHNAKLAEHAKRARERGGHRAGAKAKAPVEKGPEDKDQVNLTDPESRIMPSKGGFEQAYNAQLAVDLENGFILTGHVTNHPIDVHQLAPTIEQLATLPEEIGRAEALLADTGYYSRDNVTQCDDAAITPYIASKRQKHNRSMEERLGIAEEPAEPPPQEMTDPVAAMKHRLATKEGRALYAKRKSSVEPVFGVIKHVLGFRQFMLRGLTNVQGEWSLVCIAMNLRRMHALIR